MKMLARPREGAVLLWLILSMVILAVLGIGIIQIASTARQTDFLSAGAAQARFYAEAGLSYAQHVYCTDGWADGYEETLYPEASASVTISRAGSTWTSHARAYIDTAMEARSTVAAPVRECGSPPGGGASAGDFVITATGDFQTQGARVEGDVAVLGSDFTIQKGGSGVIEGNVFAENGITFTGNGTVRGDLYTDGNVDIKQGFVGTSGQPSEIHAGGFVETSGSSVVHATIYAGEHFAALGSSTLYGDVHACAGSITIGSGAAVFGNLYARDGITVTGGASVVGNLHSVQGAIQIDPAVDGSAYAATNVELGNRNGMLLSGEAHAGQQIFMGNKALIGGDAAAGVSIQRPGNVMGSACAPCTPGAPLPPTCPETFDFSALEPPPPTTFSAGTDDYGSGAWRETLALSPGAYGDINLNGSQSTLELESGTYTFASLSFGWEGRVVLDISSGGEVRIFISGDFRTGGNFQVFVNESGLPGGATRAIDRSNGTSLVPQQLAELIYLEAHGEIRIPPPGDWFGTLHAPFGRLEVGNGSVVIGSLFGTDDIRVQGVTVKWVPPLYFQ